MSWLLEEIEEVDGEEELEDENEEEEKDEEEEEVEPMGLSLHGWIFSFNIKSDFDPIFFRLYAE